MKVFSHAISTFDSKWTNAVTFVSGWHYLKIQSPIGDGEIELTIAQNPLNSMTRYPNRNGWCGWYSRFSKEFFLLWEKPQGKPETRVYCEERRRAHERAMEGDALENKRVKSVQVLALGAKYIQNLRLGVQVILKKVSVSSGHWIYVLEKIAFPTSGNSLFSFIMLSAIFIINEIDQTCTSTFS